MRKFIGSRTIIVNAVLLLAGILRGRHPDQVPDEATLTAIVNGILDLVISVPGAGLINILLRIVTSTAVFSGLKHS